MAAGTPSALTYGHVVSLNGRSAGKLYFEVELITKVNVGDYASQVIGVTNANPPSSSSTVTSGSPAMVWLLLSSSVRRNSPFFSASGETLTEGSSVKACLDLDAGNIWMGKVGGSWVGGGDPATDASPTMTFTPGTWYIVASTGGSSVANTLKVRLKTKSTQFLDPVPTGFTSWAGG